MHPLTRALRAHALRYPETREDFPWEEDRVIKVRNKIFVFLGSADRDFSLGVKLTHSNAAALGLPFVKPMAYGLGRSGWVAIQGVRGQRLSIDLLKAWVDESYRAVAPTTLVARLSQTPGPPSVRRDGRSAAPASRARRPGRPRSRPSPPAK